MADKGSECGDDPQLLTTPKTEDENGYCRFQNIQQQRRASDRLVASAQDVGGADISRADLAHIAKASPPRQQKTEWDRARKIADNERNKPLKASYMGPVHSSSPGPT